MRANAIEAAEQCGILRVPEVTRAAEARGVLAGWDAERRLIFCDEGAELANPIEALSALLPPPPCGGGPGRGVPSMTITLNLGRFPQSSPAHPPPQPSPARGEGVRPPLPLAVLIGPEGGFSEQERTLLLAKPFTLPISLGPRIMRADTAAVAVLALVNAVLGDWAEQR